MVSHLEKNPPDDMPQYICFHAPNMVNDILYSSQSWKICTLQAKKDKKEYKKLTDADQ